MRIEYIENKILYYSAENNKIILNDNLPSKPEISFDGEKCAFIAPNEWETKGSLYIHSLFNGKLVDKVDVSEEESIKKMVWLNSDELVLIIGKLYGTIGVGGNLYIYSLTHKNLRPLIVNPDDIQITEVYVENENLHYKGFKFIDEKYLETVDFEGITNIK